MDEGGGKADYRAGKCAILFKKYVETTITIPESPRSRSFIIMSPEAPAALAAGLDSEEVTTAGPSLGLSLEPPPQQDIFLVFFVCGIIILQWELRKKNSKSVEGQTLSRLGELLKE